MSSEIWVIKSFEEWVVANTRLSGEFWWESGEGTGAVSKSESCCTSLIKVRKLQPNGDVLSSSIPC